MLFWNPGEGHHMQDDVEDLFKAKLVMECSIAARFVRIYMICQMLGKDKMLALISDLRNKHTNPVSLLTALSWSFIEKVESLEDKGIYCFPFTNVEKYAEFKPAGMESNHNVVGLLDKTFFGFEPDFFDSPKNYEEVETRLYNIFVDQTNIDPTKKGEHQKYTVIVAKNPEFFTKMRRSHQQKIGFYKFNMEKVKSFIEKD